MFRVEWVEAAIDDLAAIWMRVDSDQRRAVTSAANAIDVALRSDPFRESESRDDERRVFFAPPLGVFFSVDLPRRVVRVGQVWHYRPRKN
jgi:hypothetical protein